MNDLATTRRDARLRRRILETLYNARVGPMRGLAGMSLFDVVDSVMSPGQGFENEQHAMGLVRDLANAKLADVRVLDRRRGQMDGLNYRFVTITDLGTQLCAEAIPPHPLVDDDRIAGGME